MKLAVHQRTPMKKKSNLLRKTWMVPAVVYGKRLDQPLHIAVQKLELLRVYEQAWQSTAIELTGDGIDQLVLFHELQVHPVTDRLIHVDFLAVNKDEKVTAEVPVVLIGESPFEKQWLGTVQLVSDTIRVSAFPLDLPQNIQIDVSWLEHPGQVIHFGDVTLGDKVEIDEDLEQTLVTLVEFENDEEEAETVAPSSTPESSE